MPMATGALSGGADMLASAIAIGVNPAKKPWTSRATKSCSTEVTSPIAPMMTTNPARERIIIALRPKRSAMRPKSGERIPDTAGVTAESTPDQSAMRPGSVTPSSRT